MSNIRDTRVNPNKEAESEPSKLKVTKSERKSELAKEFLVKPKLIRKLSAIYIDPLTLKPTQDDPKCFTGEKRVARENAVLSQLAHTGYALFITQERNRLQKLEAQSKSMVVASLQEEVTAVAGFNK